MSERFFTRARSLFAGSVALALLPACTAPIQYGTVRARTPTENGDAKGGNAPVDPLRLDKDKYLAQLVWGALGARYVLNSQDGRTIVLRAESELDWRAWKAGRVLERSVPSGTYRLRVVARCQPTYNGEVKVEPGATLDLTRGLSLPPARRLYLRDGNRVRLFDPGGRSGPLSLPAGTEVEVLRLWPALTDAYRMGEPPENARCTNAIVRVVAAGGKARTGTLMLAAESDLSPTRETTPEQAVKQEDEGQARRDAEYEKGIDEEVRRGKCSVARYNVLQKALLQTKQLFDGASSGSSQDLFTILGHDTVVATPEGTSLELSAWLGGELHLFAIGFDAVKLDLRDEKGYAIKTRSVWERLLRGQSEHTDSRAFVAASGSKYALKVKGKGCAMVLAVRKL